MALAGATNKPIHRTVFEAQIVEFLDFQFGIFWIPDHRLLLDFLGDLLNEMRRQAASGNASKHEGVQSLFPVVFSQYV